jgi:hypothetical protein
MNYRANTFLAGSLIIVIGGMLTICTAGCGNKQKNEADEKKVIAVDMEGWYSGNDHGNYVIGKSEALHDGKSVFYLRSTTKIDSGFGNIIKNIYPADYFEKRIKLTGNIKVNSIYGYSGMWMRVDGGHTGKSYFGSTLSFDNMENRLITETTDWKKYEIVLDVPKESRMIFYGFYLSGSGEVSISDFTVTVVGNDVPTTDISRK